MGKNLTGKQKSTIALKAMQHYDFKRRRMMDGCMKPFLTRLRSEMKISIDERTVRRLLETMKERRRRRGRRQNRGMGNRGESPIDLTVDMDDYNECKC